MTRNKHLSPTEAVKLANEIANAVVPEFKALDTPEHENWVKTFDAALRFLMEYNND